MKLVHTDTDAEYQALRSKTGLIEYEGAGLFRITGTSAAQFLSTVSSRNIDFLLEGQISTALVLREEGTVVAEALIHCNGPEYLIEIWPAQREAAAAHLLDAARAFPDTVVTDVSDTVRLFGLEGPESFRIAQKLLPFPISSMAYRSFVATEWEGTSLLLSRTGVTGEYGYKVHAPAEVADQLREELLSLGAQSAGLAAVDICRMEMRFANLEKEGGAEPFTPFRLSLQWMVDFEHDFIGKAALQRQWETGLDQLPVCWTAGADSAAVPATGAPVTVEGARVGEVLHAVWSPSVGRVIGTAQLDRDVAASGIDLRIGEPAQPARSVSAPFLVAASFGQPLE